MSSSLLLQKYWPKRIWFQSTNLKSKLQEHVATKFWGDSHIRLDAFQASFKLQEWKLGHQDSQHNVLAKMHLVPVIQIEIEIARTRRQQILRRHSHLPECRLFKTLSNSMNGHKVIKIANKMWQQKMHLVPIIQLEIKITKTRRHQHVRRQSCLPKCRPSRRFSNSKNRHEVIKIANKMCRQKCIKFQTSNWNRNRKNTLQPNSEETVAFHWMQTYQDTFKIQEGAWGCWDSQQNVSDKMH